MFFFNLSIFGITGTCTLTISSTVYHFENVSCQMRSTRIWIRILMYADPKENLLWFLVVLEDLELVVAVLPALDIDRTEDHAVQRILRLVHVRLNKIQ